MILRIHERVGRLNIITAAVMLGGYERALSGSHFRVQVADGYAAQQRRNSVAVRIVKYRGRGICVQLFDRRIHFAVDAYRQHRVGHVGIIAVVMYVGFARRHVRVYVDRLLRQRLRRERLGCVGCTAHQHDGGEYQRGQFFHVLYSPPEKIKAYALQKTP